MEFLKDFGVNPILLLAQIVNFTILLLLLKKFFYKPILKVLEERKHKIETAVLQAEEIQKKLEETQVQQEKLIGEAEAQASRIIEETREAAKNLQEKATSEANKKVEETLIKARGAINLEKEKMVVEVKAEMASLVADTTKKILGKTLSKQDNEEIVKQSVKELES